MYTFHDAKKNKDKLLTSSLIVSEYRTLASGATTPIKTSLVDWNEVKSIIGLRDVIRNNPLGIVITKPSENSFFVETVWEDLKDGGQHDGDITLFEEKRSNWFEFKKMKPDDIKKQYPTWHPYHHENKSYLK